MAPALLCLAVLVVASNVRFDTPFGYTVATQLAFVPMLFAVPVAVGPIAAFVAVAASGLFRVLAGKAPPSRLLLTLGNSWFAIGPAAVFAVAGTEPRDAGALLLIAALCAQFAVDFAVSSLRFWFDNGAGLAAQLRDSWVYGIDAGLSGMALIVAEDIHKYPIAALGPLPILGLLAVFARERRDRITGLLELNNAYRGTALVLGDVVEADDGYTGEHCRGVLRLALALADEVGLDAEQTRNLEFAALLHDVGKIAVPKEIINKPGKLDPHEWEIMTTHTTAGQEMLDRIGGFMRKVGLIVRSHHERWDGRWIPRRSHRPGNSARGPDHRLLRLVERDADRPFLPQGTVLRGGAGRDRRQFRAAVRPAGRRGVPEDHRAKWRAGLACRACFRAGRRGPHLLTAAAGPRTRTDRPKLVRGRSGP